MRAQAILWLAVLLGAATAATAGDWPCYRGPTRDSVSAETDWSRDWSAHPPRVLWKKNVGTGFSSIAVAGGTAYTLGNRDGTDTLWALDADTGAVRWQYRYACELDPLRHEGGPKATPTVDDGRVYTVSIEGDLFSFDAEAGRILWRANLGEVTGTPRPMYGHAASPLVVGNLLVLNAGGGGAALDKQTGRLVWKSDAERPGHASPLALGRTVVILTKYEWKRLDPASGKVAWTQDFGDRPGRMYHLVDPLIVGRNLFITASYASRCALVRADDGRKLWQDLGLVSKVLNPIAVDGHIVGSHQERSFRCVDPATGEVKWERPFAGSPLLVGGDCLILTTDGELILADVGPEAYRERARVRALTGKCWTTPAFANGRLYARNAAGDLVCLDLRKPEE